MIDLLRLRSLVGNLHQHRAFHNTGRRGVIRLLTIWQGGFHPLGESSNLGTEPPVSIDGSAIQFSAPLRFDDDARFVKAPLTQWRIDVETRTLLRLVDYIDQYVKNFESNERDETSVLGDLKAKYKDKFVFELDLKVRVQDMNNHQLRLLIRELVACTNALHGLLRHFESMSGSEIQRMPSEFLKYTGEDIVNFFNSLSWRFS